MQPVAQQNIHVQQIDECPDLLDLHATYPQRYPCLLESVDHGTSQSRYDILFAFPGDVLSLNNQYILESARSVHNNDFLNNLDSWWQQEKIVEPADDMVLPFRGGWFLYLGYELTAQIEPTLELPRSQQKLPVALAMRIPAAVIRDNEARKTYLVAEPGQEALLATMSADMAALISAPIEKSEIDLVENVTEEPLQTYLDGVARIKKYITEGDVFQVNLSRQWEVTLAEDVLNTDLYNCLRHHNPAPFAGLMTCENATIISSSPERLVQVKGNTVRTRPIAGTRPRNASSDIDNDNSRELLAHPKERAEHIMLIDLERNDLGRVCEPGSINVDELMVLESYTYVHHIVSSVQGQLRDDVSPGQVIRAVFPGGTITGCPKVRCMEIIAELEKTARGPYTGSMGYLNRDGSMDLNILIRSMVRESNKLGFRAGAGIVADSVADKELEETRDKARGLLMALGKAE